MTSLNLQGTYKILLAHRSPAISQLLEQTLRDAGYRRIKAVESGADAINSLRSNPFDLLVTGLELTDTDGWRLIRMVRSGRFCPNTLPVVILCEDKQRQLIEPLAREHGAAALDLKDIARLPAIAAACDLARTKPAVLIVEDDEQAANLVKLSLQKSYAVEIAYDGETGLAAWTARQHHLVLLDMMLPGLPGPEVLRAILKLKPKQPVIIITAYGTQDRHRDLMLAGATEFVYKPLDINRLRALCEDVLRYSAYLSQCAELQREEGVRDEVSYRVWAANQCLSTGRAGMAARHLRHALSVSTTMRPGDDDWVQLLHEFNS